MLLANYADAATAACMKVWSEEQSLADYPTLVMLAHLTPLFVGVTFLISMVNTIQHVKEAKCEPLWNQKNRYMTIWILQLPPVYSICTLFAVQTALQRARTGAYDCRVNGNFLAFLSEAALSFGDGYEGIALLLFAEITMGVIKFTVDKVVDEAEEVNRELEGNEAAHRKILRLEQVSEVLVKASWKVSALGIQYFSFTCLLIALPMTFGCQMKIMAKDVPGWGFEQGYNAAHAFCESWSCTLKGMGLLGSCVAIHNMVEIENRFDDAFLEGWEFHTTLKFISVKIMVSIVFMQQIFLPIAFGLSQPRSDVLDSTLRAGWFCLIVIFNYRAWPVKQPWYKNKFDSDLDIALLGQDNLAVDID
jgi:hypothetical protein